MSDERRDAPTSVAMLPADPFWPIRVQVKHDGDPVPFHVMLLYHWQMHVPPNRSLPA